MAKKKKTVKKTETKIKKPSKKSAGKKKSSKTTEIAPPPDFESGYRIKDDEVEHLLISGQHRRQHTLELRLALGSITEADARAYVMGVFKHVEPAGAAAAIDERLDGAVKEFSNRRMFTADVGDVFVMPTGRSTLPAESVLFAGLGSFDQFDGEVQQFVCENVVRTFVRTNVEDFATVLMGTGSGLSVSAALYSQLKGFLSGLRDADSDQRTRRITLCEYNVERYQAIKEELYRLASTDLFDDFRVIFDEVELPTPLVVPAARRQRISENANLAYLIVNEIGSDEDSVLLRSSVLTAGSKAAILTDVNQVSKAARAKILDRIEGGGFNYKNLARYGADLGDLTLGDNVKKGLSEMQDYHLVVVHDESASQFPWETICLDGWFPAANQGISRRYAAGNLSVAKWREQRRLGDTLDILLIVNPTEDLPGAKKEGDRIEKIFPSDSRIKLTKLEGSQATRQALLEAFNSGNYDVIHYAGHAFFNSQVRARSGILCHGDKVISGADLAGLSQLPALVFFNACESARVRSKRKRGAKPDLNMSQMIERNTGLAEAFLRGGVANYLGTYWPVGDDAAEEFASVFYRHIVNGSPVGKATTLARKKIAKLSNVDFSDYVHYGSYDFVIKNLNKSPSEKEDGSETK